MEIREVTHNKKRYLSLLLLADEQESMIDRYLERGEMFAVYEDGRPIAVGVVTDEGNGIGEIKNLAVRPEFQRQGHGHRLLRFFRDHYRGRFRELRVGTGDSPLTLPFYENFGFIRSHRILGFFTEHYDHPIVENGRLLTDMIYLKLEL